MYKYQGAYILHTTSGMCIPKDEANSDYIRYLEWVKDGGVTEEEFTEEEIFASASIQARLARDAELARADIQLHKVQDGVTGIGTQKAWRAYRCELRNWPASENFPEVFPTPPDA